MQIDSLQSFLALDLFFAEGTCQTWIEKRACSQNGPTTGLSGCIWFKMAADRASGPHHVVIWLFSISKWPLTGPHYSTWLFDYNQFLNGRWLDPTTWFSGYIQVQNGLWLDPTTWLFDYSQFLHSFHFNFLMAADWAPPRGYLVIFRFKMAADRTPLRSCLTIVNFLMAADWTPPRGYLVIFRFKMAADWTPLRGCLAIVNFKLVADWTPPRGYLVINNFKMVADWAPPRGYVALFN